MKEQDQRVGVKYQKLVDDIRKQIKNGEYKRGDKLTSENKLAEAFGYSRQTVRQALGVLENEGLLERKRGSGTYIAGAVPTGERSYHVGVIATYLSDYIFPLIIGGIEEVLTPAGYHITLGVTQNKVEEEYRVLQGFADRKIDGLIVEGTKSAFPNPNMAVYRKLRDLHIPVVFFNGYYAELEDSVYVVTDDRQAGFELTSHLIARGCQRIGGIFKSDDMQGHRRYAGYSAAILSAGLQFDDDKVLWYTTSDEARFRDEDFDKFLLKSFASCDGVICYNDKIAVSLLACLARAGRLVPRDVMLGSFDHSRISEYAAVPLTSMNHPKGELGRIAAQKLLGMLEGERHPPSVKLPMQLMIKDSTK